MVILFSWPDDDKALLQARCISVFDYVVLIKQSNCNHNKYVMKVRKLLRDDAHVRTRGSRCSIPPFTISRLESNTALTGRTASSVQASTAVLDFAASYKIPDS